jgi:acetyl-CoA carboxylase carboxyl transferase subunit alpha
MMATKNKEFVLEFDKPVVELENKILEMRESAVSGGLDLEEDIKRLETKAEELRKEIYNNLTRWQRVQLARHPKRPYSNDYIYGMCSYFEELHGDRFFADDPAIIAGLGIIDDVSVVIVGQQKGRDTKDKLYRNFGMPNPEGYRKAIRVMELAAKYNKPIITLIDTPGAYPGLGAEERGQAEAIAYNLFVMSQLPTPIISVVVGEGASGGALGIGVSDKIVVMENSWYSVISPEGCAAILWRDAAKAPEAAEAMKVGAGDLKDLGIADEVLKEPFGGAHKNYAASISTVKKSVLKHIKQLAKLPAEALINKRIEKYSKMGDWTE